MRGPGQRGEGGHEARSGGDGRSFKFVSTPEIEARLANLSQASGRSKTFSLRKLIEEHLDELEDAYLAEHAIEQLRQGRDRVIAARSSGERAFV